MSWIRSNAILALSFGLAACCIAGLGFKTHCLVNGVWYDLIQYSTGCYSDAVPFWGLRGVAAGQIPYFDARIEYPVLTGALIWLEGIITRSIFGSDAIATNFLIVVVLVNAVLAFLVLMMLRRFELPRARMWAWAASPLLLLYIGQNWDMLAVGLTVCALWMARNDRLFEAAILAGLGASAKLYPALVVPVLCLQALSLGGTSPISQRLTRALAVGATGAGAWLIVNAPVAILASENWLEFYRFSSERGTTAASIWGLLESSELLSISPNLRNLIAMGSVVVGTIAILAIGSRRHSDHLWTLSVPIIAWFVFMNKVYSPQFDLWLYPLFLLTIRRTAPIVTFALGSILAFYSELWWFSFQEGGPIALDRWALELATVIRAAGLVWAMGSAIFEPAPWWIAGDRPPNCSKATTINGASVSNLPMSKPSAPKEGMYDEWGRIISPRHRTSLKSLTFQIPAVKNRTPDEDPLALCVIATFTFFAIASYGLLSPSSLFFDETHYVPAARSLLELVAANQEHPLLAKEIMAASIRLLGDHPLGWRLPSLLAGALGLFAFGRLVWWTSHRRFATIAAIALLGTNFLWFIHSRIAMLDIFAASLFLVALWQFAKTRSDGATHLRLRLAVTGTLLGLALGAKWNVAPLLPVPGVIFALFCLKEHQQAPSVTNFRDLVFARDRKWRLAEGLLFLGILPLCVYWLTFTPAFFYATPETAISPFDFIGQHIKMVASQASAVGSHPYQSIWTDWLLNRRPVWYLYENIDGAQRGVLLLGNPFTMLAGLPAVLWCCAAALQKRRADCALFAGLFLIAIGFWIVAAKPVQFYYHYLLPATFLAGCMALALDEIFSRSDWTRWIGATAVLFACVMFAWFYPIISAIPLAKGPGAFETWMWIDSWR